MALSIPGLGLSASTTTSAAGASSSTTQTAARSQTLAARTEWRFEVAFSQQYTIKLTSGNAELWGTELALNLTYTFSGSKGAVFTWQGCTLDVNGAAEAEYLGEDTSYAVEWLNVHGSLQEIRDQATKTGSEAPRVLVVGPDHVGKSSLVKTLTAWGVRMGMTPTVLNLDPREGILAPPSSLTAAAVSASMDVEIGYGMPPIAGATALPVKTPLVHDWPFASPSDNPSSFKQLITRMALHVTGRLETDSEVKRSGVIIDTPGALNDPKSSYDLLHHVISEFSITLILVFESERLNSDLHRRYSPDIRTDGNGIPVVKLRKPAGTVDRDNAFMRQLRSRQIQNYFFGPPGSSLNPHSHSVAFADLHIYRFLSSSNGSSDLPSFGPGMDDDYEPEPVSSAFESVAPSTALTAALIAIKFCSGSNAEEAEIRDSPVMGYVYVAEVDEGKKRVRFLAPHPQRWGDRAMVLGGFPEAVPDLVA